jgi:prepilin-type N-terminal cleavage/methylation domain-containing protein
MKSRYGFTLTELMVGLGIFSLLALVIYNLSGTFSRGARQAVEQSSSVEGISRFVYNLKEQLSNSDSFNWPPLKINADYIEFYFHEEKIKFFSRENKLYKQVDNQPEPSLILSGLKKINFYRQDTKLLFLDLETDRLNINTAFYLESL